MGCADDNLNNIKSYVMQRVLSSLIKFGFCAILALGAAVQAQDSKVNPAGTWSWSMPGRNGGTARTNTMVLKLVGDKLTGEISSPGRDGAVTKTEIAEAKLKGDEISFSVTREFNGNKMVFKYTGKVAADTIKGKIAREGQTEPREWEAKRQADKK